MTVFCLHRHKILHRRQEIVGTSIKEYYKYIEFKNLIGLNFKTNYKYVIKYFEKLKNFMNL